jgi:hypothetical protein
MLIYRRYKPILTQLTHQKYADIHSSVMYRDMKHFTYSQLRYVEAR